MTKQCTSDNCAAFTVSELDKLAESEFAAMAKALSHPARVRIVKLLLDLDKRGGCLNSDLVSQLGLAQSTVSEHLRILKQAEFITAEPNPPKVCYRVNREQLAKFGTDFGSLFS